MTQASDNFDETPYRVFLYEYFGLFFRGERDETWRARWTDALKVTSALCDEDLDFALPDAVALEKACATAFYGVGSETVPLAQSCWENDKQLHCGDACRQTHELYARYGLVNDLPDHLPDDHIAIVLAFAAELLRRGETKAFASFIRFGVGSWWPKAEAALRARSEWSTLAPVLETFGRFLAREVKEAQTTEH